MITIQIPSQLLVFTEGRGEIVLVGTTLNEAFRSLDNKAPMMRSQIFEPTGNLRRFVALFLDEIQVTKPDFDSPVHDGAQLIIVMSVAGG